MQHNPNYHQKSRLNDGKSYSTSSALLPLDVMTGFKFRPFADRLEGVPRIPQFSRGLSILPAFEIIQRELSPSSRNTLPTLYEIDSRNSNRKVEKLKSTTAECVSP